MSNVAKAIEAARDAWEDNTDFSFNTDAFLEAVRHYMSVLVNPDAPVPPKADEMKNWTISEHFLALSSGNYLGYTMTPGIEVRDKLTIMSPSRHIVCFQPDPKSSVLIPLFMSIHDWDEITDMQGRNFKIPIVDNKS